MITVMTIPEQSGSILLCVVSMRKKKWKKWYIRFERYYSKKRTIKLLRDLADAIEGEENAKVGND